MLRRDRYSMSTVPFNNWSPKDVKLSYLNSVDIGEKVQIVPCA